MTAKEKLSRSQDLAQKVALVYSKRTQIAREQFSKSVAGAVEANTPTAGEAFAAPAKLWMDWHEYAVDAAQRIDPVLGHDAPARQRLRRAREAPDCRRCCTSTTRWCVDGRKLERPVNYALVRIIPPEA